MKCPLSPKQIESVQHFANGEGSKSAARLMDTSPNTIEGYLQIARLKVSARTTSELVAICIRNGWIR